MKVQKAIALPLIAASLALSTGCSAKPSSDGHVKTQASAKTNHAHMKTSKTSAPQHYMKPGAAIRYEHNLPSDIAPGQTAVFQLTLSESYDSGTMSVNVSGGGDIQIFPSSNRASFDMSEGRQHVMDVSVTVGSLGRHYINVRAEAESGGQIMPRIFSIPVQSGPVKAMKPNSKMTKTSSGENIIIMEAVETIK